MTHSNGRIGTSRRRVLKATGAIVAGLAAPTFLRMSSALAACPDRPIKIVVANTPGGPSDISARMMAAEMQQVLGGSVFVENKGGAGGNIGYGFVARSEPDGYTILLTTSAYVVNPSLYNSIPYDPFKDFVAICEPVVTPHVFAVKSDLPAKNMKEFVALVKANPDKFNVSTPPIGTTPQLQAEVLKMREGLQKMATVVFQGGGDAVKAVLADTVQLNSGTLAPALPQIQAGTLAGAGADRREALHRAARRPDHGGAGLQGFRVRHLLRADGAGQGPPRDRRQAREGLPGHPGQGRIQEKAGDRGLRRDRQGRQGPRRRGSPRKSRCSRRSSRTPGSPSCSRVPSGAGTVAVRHNCSAWCGPIITVACEFLALQQIAMRLGIEYGVRCWGWAVIWGLLMRFLNVAMPVRWATP